MSLIQANAACSVILLKICFIESLDPSPKQSSQPCPSIQKLLLDIHCIYFWWAENIALLTWGKFYKQKKKTKIKFAHKENLNQNMILQIVQLIIFVSYRQMSWGCNLQSSTKYNDSLWFNFLLEIQLALIFLKDLQSDDWYNLHSENR